MATNASIYSRFKYWLGWKLFGWACCNCGGWQRRGDFFSLFTCSPKCSAEYNDHSPFNPTPAHQ